MSSSSGMKSMWKEEKPQYPDCQGSQFAVNPYGDNYLGVSYDQFSNEQAEDRPMHAEATPQKGSPNFSGGQYDDSPAKGGFGSYGVPVADLGQNPSSERTAVDVRSTDRGKES